jgi:hypothetical protein
MTGGEIWLENNEMISGFAQYALNFSVTVLYCVAFAGTGKEIWFALLPPFGYFMSFFIRYFAEFGFIRTLSYLLIDDSMALSKIRIITMSVIFFLWSLLCIFVSSMVYRIISKAQDNKKLKNRRMNNRRSSRLNLP